MIWIKNEPRCGPNQLPDHSLAASLRNPQPSLAWISCLTNRATLLGRGGRGRGRGRSWRRSLLGILRGFGGGGFGGGGLDGGLDGFQFLHRFVAGIHGALTMTVEVFFGTFQLRFGPF
jgi:hypothetical protein